MLTIDGYSVTERIHNGARNFVYRARRLADQQSVVLKLSSAPYPSQADRARALLEFDTLRECGSDTVLRALALEDYEQRLVLVLEDFGARSLLSWIESGAGDLQERLRIAITVTVGLGELHARHIIHKDINPSNILYDGRGNAKIADLDIITVLSRENPEARSPNQIEGTLAYISPEQTGRMNRPMDYRTDLYSLGATLYQLFTGERVFESREPMELLHAHMARPPIPPVERQPGLPAPISDIILKLLSKNAEDRYQSTSGLRADLRSCLEQLERHGDIEPFELGLSDVTERFEVPLDLFGREQELATLLGAFDAAAAADTRAALVLVSGAAGIGKSMLINELQKPITRQYGYFIAGKFDQYQRATPYSALIVAFRSLLRQLLGESEGSLARWRASLTDALGANARVVTELIPDLALIIGEQPEVASLAANEAQNRFNHVFRSFIRVFARPEHPLVLFLDDLQWADNGSVKLLETLLRDDDPLCLLVTGAYRDNEVSEAHPLALAVSGLNRAGVGVQTINLGPLPGGDITRMVASAVACDEATARPLGELVAAKTEGNPLFVSELLKAMYTDRLLTFERDEGAWRWDMATIEAEAITDNVVELMLGKLRRLPTSAQDAMKASACLGNSFKLNTLALVLGASEEEVFDQLLPALQEGFLHARSDLGADRELRFMHDRVQQAAYELVPERERASLHLRIGRTLADRASASEQEEQLFDVVDQMNHGLSLLRGGSLTELADLNRRAAAQAHAALAYDTALNYLRIARACLTPESWETDYALTHSVHQLMGEVEALLGNLKASEALLLDTAERSRTNLERAVIYGMLTSQYTHATRYDDALAIAQRGGALLGVDLPSDKSDEELGGIAGEVMGAVFGLIGERPVASLADAPEMTDPEATAALRIINAAIPPAFFRSPTLYGVLIFRGIELMLKFGQSPMSSDLYGSGGHVIGAFTGNWPLAYELGKLSLALSDRFENPAIRARAHFIVANFVAPWMRHYKESLQLNIDGYAAGLAGGELLYAGYSLIYQPYQRFYCGAPLDEVAADIPAFLSFNRKTNNTMSVDVLLSMDLVLRNLRGDTNAVDDFRGEELDDAGLQSSMAARQSVMAQAFYPVLKAEALYLHGQYAASQAALAAGAPLLPAIVGHPCVAFHAMFRALCMTATHAGADEATRASNKEQLAAIVAQFEGYAASGPDNWSHPLSLIQAEVARVEGREVEASELYDRAIDQANAGGFLQHEALANELAAEFWLGRGRRRAARAYLAEALHAYQLRGASRKVAMMRERHAELMPRTRSADATSSAPGTTAGTATGTGTGTSEVLDLGSVIKAMQAVSSEIVLDQLLSKLMTTVIESAGAQKGTLVLVGEDGELSVRVDARVADTIRARVLEPTPIDRYEDACEEVLRLTARTRTTVLLDDASSEGNFVQTAYVRSHKPRSVLCAPLIKQGTLVGVVYLENNLAPQAFTPARVELLQILATQIAISLENARLFSQTDEMARSFSRFVPREFLEHLGKRRITDVVRGDAVQRQMTVLFCDIRSFTTFSEAMTARELFAFLNDYLERVGPVIRANNGFIDKYIGDAVMALFPENPRDAIAASVALLQQVERFNAERESPITVGVGIHFGSLILGTIGEQQRIDSTVISDAVNTASRLEGLTKPLAASTLVSGESFGDPRTRAGFQHRYLGLFLPRGRKQTIDIYEIYDAAPPARREALTATRASMERGVRAYIADNLDDADAAFAEVLEQDPDDGTAAFYRARVAAARSEGTPGPEGRTITAAK